MKKKQLPPQRSRWIIIFQITLVYYFTLFWLLVWATGGWEGIENPQPIPDSHIKLIQFYLYVIPVVLSCLFGLLFRPFREHFRNLFSLIVFLQAIYSFGVYYFRYEYVQSQRTHVQEARLQVLKPTAFKHRFLDENKDGLVEKVQFAGYVDAGKFPSGQYFIRPILTQKGLRVTTAEFKGVAKFEIADQPLAPFLVRFSVDPQGFSGLLGKGDFELNLAVQRIISAGTRAKVLRALSRWSPYLRTTLWSGEDLDLQSGINDVDYVQRVDSFSLLPLKW